MSTEVYQAFMIGYVRRINEATLNVKIGGVRIGAAKYSRLAQINLNTRIITFSRYAIENVPERGRRYLVIHELSHVKEPNHNENFWDMVGKYEPNYRQIGKALELAFKRNVKEDQLNNSHIKLPNPLSGRLEQPKLLLSPRLTGIQASGTPLAGEDSLTMDFSPPEDDDNCFDCTEDAFGGWAAREPGIVYGGSPLDVAVPNLVL